MKKLFIILSMVAISTTINAQFSMNYYYDGNTLGISTSPEKPSWLELRVNTIAYNYADWQYADRGIIQAYYCFKLISDEKAGLYSGLGVGVPLLAEEIGWASINVPIGVQMNPFNQLPHLFITGEYNGMMMVTEEFDLVSTVSVGFKYVFGGKNK